MALIATQAGWVRVSGQNFRLENASGAAGGTTHSTGRVATGYTDRVYDTPVA
jgi:hypothetical protein